MSPMTSSWPWQPRKSSTEGQSDAASSFFSKPASSETPTDSKRSLFSDSMSIGCPCVACSKFPQLSVAWVRSMALVWRRCAQWRAVRIGGALPRTASPLCARNRCCNRMLMWASPTKAATRWPKPQSRNMMACHVAHNGPCCARMPHQHAAQRPFITGASLMPYISSHPIHLYPIPVLYSKLARG